MTTCPRTTPSLSPSRAVTPGRDDTRLRGLLFVSVKAPVSSNVVDPDRRIMTTSMFSSAFGDRLFELGALSRVLLWILVPQPFKIDQLPTDRRQFGAGRQADQIKLRLAVVHR